MEQAQTQVCLGALGDKRPTQRRDDSCFQRGGSFLAWNRTAQNRALPEEKTGRKLSAQRFQISLLNGSKYALEGIFHGSYIYAGLGMLNTQTNLVTGGAA
jgi:hypothetical protein